MKKTPLFTVLLLVVVSSVCFYYTVSANGRVDWLGDVLYIAYRASEGKEFGCEPDNYYYTHIEGTKVKTASYYGCVILGDIYDYLVHPSTHNTQKEALVFAARPHNEGVFHHIRGDNVNRTYYPESKQLIESQQINVQSHTYRIYGEESSLFTPIGDDIVAEYELNQGLSTVKKFTVTIDDTHGLLLTKSGQYLIGTYRKNNTDMMVRIDIVNETVTYGRLLDVEPKKSFSVRGISDDGRWLYVERLANYNTVIDRFMYDTLSCAEEANYCQRRDLRVAYSGEYENAMDTMAKDVEFSEDGSQLNLWGSPGYRYILSLIPIDDGRLDYLALGDSFSSGEGDLERNEKTKLKSYREHTDDGGTPNVDGYTEQVNPKEKCHLSTNSYPYHLADGMGLGLPTTDSNTTRWQSVACSGATTWDIKERGSMDYKGQNDDTNKPRLEGYDFTALKDTALNEFIPGRQKQIEFVKKYKPKVITLTVGGNDINFGGKMKECVQSPATCPYTTERWRVKLKNEIFQQFSNLNSLYNELRDATGGDSKIYVVGYPVYINADPVAKCSKKLLFLNLEEREMIVNSILYLNNIIEAAAKNAGVTYVDIEHSFNDHRLCDNNESHVNAVAGILGYGGNETQESFHPNKKGHEDMAIAIWDYVNGDNLLDHQTCPDAQKNTCPDNSIDASSAKVPPYFLNTDVDDNTTIRYYTLTDGTLMKSVKHYDVETGETKLKPNSKVDVNLYSTPTHLGEFTVGYDGRLSASIIVPASVPAGYHRLSVTGTSIEGNSIEIYQTVLVRGQDDGDGDEDGVPDWRDKCIYGMPVDDNVDIGTDEGCVTHNAEVSPKLQKGINNLGQTKLPDFALDSHKTVIIFDESVSAHQNRWDTIRTIHSDVKVPTTKSNKHGRLYFIIGTIALAILPILIYAKNRKQFSQ